MQATAEIRRRVKDTPDNTDHSVHQVTAYTVIGVIVLIRTNRHMSENLRVISVLYLTGAAWGILIDLMGITF